MKKKLQNTLCAVFFFVTLSVTAQQATLMINEVNPNISGFYDRIELVAITGGSTSALSVEQIGNFNNFSSIWTGNSLVNVSAGDIIVIHCNGHTEVGAALGPEWLSKTEYSNALYPANYDNAWDLWGTNLGLTYYNNVLVVKNSAQIIDAVPFTTYGQSPNAFPDYLATIMAQHQWHPSDCGGPPCSYFSFPPIESMCVNWLGCDSTLTGKTMQRMSFIDTDSSSDWTSTPQPPTWGALNPGQIVSVNEENNPASKVFVFPNPVANELAIETAELRINKIEIYDVVGQRVFSQLPITNSQRQIINVSTFSSGIYFVVATDGKNIARKKFVKE